MQESITRRAGQLTDLSLKIWGYAEAGFLEIKSAEAQIAYLREEGSALAKASLVCPRLS